MTGWVAGVALAVLNVCASVAHVARTALLPMNHITDCQARCTEGPDQGACLEFCNCVHARGETLDDCLAAYGEAE